MLPADMYKNIAILEYRSAWNSSSIFGFDDGLYSFESCPGLTEKQDPQYLMVYLYFCLIVIFQAI